MNEIKSSEETPLETTTEHLFTYIIPPITGFITLYVEKKHLDAKYHAYQSILLGVLFFGAFIILSMFLPQFLEYYVLTVLKTLFFGVWIYCLWMAYKNTDFALPYIGKLARKMADGENA